MVDRLKDLALTWLSNVIFNGMSLKLFFDLETRPVQNNEKGHLKTHFSGEYVCAQLLFHPDYWSSRLIVTGFTF